MGVAIETEYDFFFHTALLSLGVLVRGFPPELKLVSLQGFSPSCVIPVYHLVYRARDDNPFRGFQLLCQ